MRDVPYHGHLLTIVWDRDGTHYNTGSGLQVFQDGARIYQSATVGDATIAVAAPIIPAAATPLDNVAANPRPRIRTGSRAGNRTYTPTFPKVFASYTNTASNGNRCHSADNPRCVAAHDSPLKAIDGCIRYDKMPDDRWTNAGSTNATDYLGRDFAQPRPINEVKIYTYDDGQNIRVPASYDVQYLSGTTWARCRGRSRPPPRRPPTRQRSHVPGGDDLPVPRRVHPSAGQVRGRDRARVLVPAHVGKRESRPSGRVSWQAFPARDKHGTACLARKNDGPLGSAGRSGRPAAGLGVAGCAGSGHDLAGDVCKKADSCGSLSGISAAQCRDVLDKSLASMASAAAPRPSGRMVRASLCPIAPALRLPGWRDDGRGCGRAWKWRGREPGQQWPRRRKPRRQRGHGNGGAGGGAGSGLLGTGGSPLGGSGGDGSGMGGAPAVAEVVTSAANALGDCIGHQADERDRRI